MGGISKVLKNTIGGALGIFGGNETKTPDVISRDPEAEEKAAKEKADAASSLKASEDKKKKKQQSLLSTGGESGNGNNGKTTLGS